MQRLVVWWLIAINFKPQTNSTETESLGLERLTLALIRTINRTEFAEILSANTCLVRVMLGDIRKCEDALDLRCISMQQLQKHSLDHKLLEIISAFVRAIYAIIERVMKS